MHALHWPQYLVILWWAITWLVRVHKERGMEERVTVGCANIGIRAIFAVVLAFGGFW